MNMLFAETAVNFSFSVPDIIVFVGFIVAVIFISVRMSGSAGESSADYFLAGRGLKWWLIGFSLIAANISAEQFVGMSGNAAQCTGLAIASYEWIAAISLIAVAFIFLPMFLKRGIYTIPEFLEYRYNKLSRSLLSLFMMIILVGVSTAAVIYLGALTIYTLFAGQEILGVQVTIVNAAWVMGLVACIYVFIGGLKACAWADLLQGSALIIGGALVMFYAFGEFKDEPLKNVADTPIYTRPEAYQTLENANMVAKVSQETPVLEKFQAINADKLHMLRPLSDPNIVWTTLLLGIWIPNLYYWGLNQYIMQRTLGSHSLAEGQKGLVFAAGMKLLIPFIVVIPGILAFNLYHNEMSREAQTDTLANKSTLELYGRISGGQLLPSDNPKTFFVFNQDFSVLHPELAREITQHNIKTLGKDVSIFDLMVTRERTKLLDEKDAADKALVPILKENSVLADNLAVWNVNKKLKDDLKMPTVLESFSGKKAEFPVAKELIGYKYDSAFPLLLKHLPFASGIRGFILAALMGAVLSSLAAMLNAASTIFTMDIYKEYINKNASEKGMVKVGRICVLVFSILACLLVPFLADPKFGGLFKYIQEFQGYLSPGVLAIFVFGLLAPRVPGFAGALTLLLGPCVYGAMKIVPCPFLSRMNFLNQMALTFIILLIFLAILTFFFPRKEPLQMEAKTDMDLTSSRGAFVAGMFVLVLTVGLYIFFW
ncbi:MAG: sodium/solute symporter [Planctomycetia bacterium]|nr:sodium/solute symporter [Planctomycetia bacterium]